MGYSQLLGGHVSGLPPKVYTYGHLHLYFYFMLRSDCFLAVDTKKNQKFTKFFANIFSLKIRPCSWTTRQDGRGPPVVSVPQVENHCAGETCWSHADARQVDHIGVYALLDSLHVCVSTLTLCTSLEQYLPQSQNRGCRPIYALTFNFGRASFKIHENAIKY